MIQKNCSNENNLLKFVCLGDQLEKKHQNVTTQHRVINFKLLLNSFPDGKQKDICIKYYLKTALRKLNNLVP